MHQRSRVRRPLLLAFLVVGTSVTCRDDQTTEPLSPDVTAVPEIAAPMASVGAATTTSEVLVGAGDIANCSRLYNAEATAKLLDDIGGTVFTVGDNAYTNGAATEYADCYAPTWGRHKARTRPAAGERDYRTSGATGYFGYFGAAAGDPAKGYYSYDLGAWHVVVLNTKLDVGATSTQVNWLRSDLTASSAACTAVIMHQPYYSSISGVRPALQPVWKVLHEKGVELVVSADNPVYERFAPQDAGSTVDAAYGVRQFVVGTGGATHTPFGTILPNSEARSTAIYGVLKLTLNATSYAWQFVPVAGKTYTDSGSGACHGAPGSPPPGG